LGAALAAEGGGEFGDVDACGAHVHAEAVGDDGVGVALDEERGDGLLTGRHPVQGGASDGLRVHGGGQAPEAVEGGGEVGEERGVADLQGQPAVLAGRDEGDRAVDGDEPVGDLVEGPGLRVAPELLVAGQDEGLVALGVLVEGPDAAAPVQQGLVAGHGDALGRLAARPVVVDVGLDAEHLAGRLGHRLGDGRVDPFRAAENPQGHGIRWERAAAGDAHEGFEERRQLFLAAPFLGDAGAGGAQQPVQGEGRGHGFEPGQVVDDRVQQAEVDKARRRSGVGVAHMSFAQGAGVQFQARPAQFLRTVRVRRCRHG
jgi:hypothetical protein